MPLLNSLRRKSRPAVHSDLLVRLTLFSAKNKTKEKKLRDQRQLIFLFLLLLFRLQGQDRGSSAVSSESSPAPFSPVSLPVVGAGDAHNIHTSHVEEHLLLGNHVRMLVSTLNIHVPWKARSRVVLF